MATKEIELKLGGMSSPTSAQHVETMLDEIDGIVTSKVSYKEGKATITYHPDQVDLDEIIDTLDNSKYCNVEKKIT